MSTKTFLKSAGYLLLIISCLLLTSCAPLLYYGISELLEDDKKGGEEATGENYSPTTPVIEASSTYAVALGGVAPGRDELILIDASGNIKDFTDKSLEFRPDTDVVGLLPRPGYEDFATGSGAKIIPQRVGFTFITYYIDNIEQADRFLAIVPPQSLIQMSVAEGSTQLTQEAEIENSSHVKLTSVSPTGDALGAVTRNRVDAIGFSGNYYLFGVNQVEWDIDPPASHYDSVILADNGGLYQYSPVDPANPAHKTFTDAEARSFLDPAYHRAYDQAVLTSAYIFSNKTADPTGDAFAFFSPTEEEYEKILLAYSNNMVGLPEGCGVSDEDFPEFAPIQILILPNVWTYTDGRPSFVFIRSRESTEYAVVNTP